MTEPRLLECRACGTGWSSTLGPTCERCGAMGTALYPDQDEPSPMPAKAPGRIAVIGSRKGLPIAGEGPRQTEADFQRMVIDLLRTFGYRVAHFRPGMTGRLDANGKTVWVTPVQGDGKGFLDVLAISEAQRRGMVIELKVKGRKCTPEQNEWLKLFALAGWEAYVWTDDMRTEDIAEIARKKP